MSRNNIWINLTKKYCDKTIDDSYGFTIPYIVGLEKEFNNRIDFTIENIFTDINSSDEVFTISYCEDLEELIIGKHKNSYPNINTLNRIENIVLNSEIVEDFTSVKELISMFEYEYNSKIINNEYSKNYYTKKWSNFDDQDEILIKRLLNIK